jgi:lipid-binding SYLF domain-containing protein
MAGCIAVIPGFKKGAAGVGVGFGRGFISCRTNGGWSAPAAISLETASIGSDASAAWGNGKSAHEDPNAQVVFYGETKGVFAGFGLDGATLKRDQSGDKSLYGKEIPNSQIVDSATTPPIAQAFIDKLAQTAPPAENTDLEQCAAGIRNKHDF